MAKNRSIKQRQYCDKFNKDFKEWSTLKKKEDRGRELAEIPALLSLGWL